jgi:imidazole glycerol-phosphate synthase subunit HisH
LSLAIVDYGSGNLHSAHKALERAAGAAGFKGEIKVTSKPEDILAADRIVLPGVGAFADCRRGLESVPGLIEALTEATQTKARPFLGICVGMQLMATRGLEHETTEGLGWIEGEVAALEPDDPRLKIPHMGWNTLDVAITHPILEGIPTGRDGWHAYFVHSYGFRSVPDAAMIAATEYGGRVTAIVGRDNMVGTQFHPEKSQGLGLALLGNFLRWKP